MKKLSTIIICLLMVFTCAMTGCASFSIDKVKYYNEVLATVGDEEITRYELLSAYNSYGQSYFVSQQGMSEDEALNETLDLLIDKEAMYQYGVDHNDLYKPTAYQVNEIVKEIFDSLDSQMEEYIKTSKKLLNIEVKENSSSSDNGSDTAYLREDYSYKKRAEIVKENGVDVIKYIEEDDEITQKYISDEYLADHTKQGIVNEIKTKYLSHLEQELTRKESDNAKVIENKTIEFFAKNLIEYEKYLRDEKGNEFSKNTNDLLFRYFERTFEDKIKSQYLENINTYYMKNIQVYNIEVLTTQFEKMTKSSYNKYNDKDEAEDYKSEIKAIGTGGDSILYHPTLEDGTKFGYFIHTLINFSDEQKADIENLSEEKDETKKETKKANIVAKTTAKARNTETGLVDEDAEEISLDQIIAEYNQISGTYEEKLSKFIDFMFKYTGDHQSTLVQGMPYVVGSNGNSQMEEAFTNESVRLMETGVLGAMTEVNSAADIMSAAITSYGIHFIFYVGNVNAYDVSNKEYSIAYISSENVKGMEHLNLYTKVINPLTGETYFDMLFDKVYPASSSSIYSSNSDYNNYEERILNEVKSGETHKVVKYTTKIKATKVSL